MDEQPMPWLQRHWRLLVVVVCTAVLSVLVLAHVNGINGPSYWRYPWRRLAAARVYPLMILAASPLFLGLWMHSRRSQKYVAPISLAMLAMFLLQLAGLAVQSDPMSLAPIAKRVQSAKITSYFTDARKITDLDSWVDEYPARMPGFRLHSRTKPPGPILFYVPFIRGAETLKTAARWGGITIAVLATLSVPATFFLVRSVGASRDAALYGATFFALLPAPLLFFPEFDQVYAALCAAIVALWIMALERRSAWYALGFGVCLTAVTFLSYSLLVIGAFLGMVTVYFVLLDWRQNMPVALKLSAIGLSVPIVFHLPLWLLWSFEPLATFQAAMAEQAKVAEWLQRPYPQSALFDLTEFALGLGWLSLALMGFCALRRTAEVPPRPTGEVNPRIRWMLLFVIAQLVIIAVAAITPAETARLWIFLMPLTMIGVGVELEHWRPLPRFIAFACALLLTSVICQNIVFIQ